MKKDSRIFNYLVFAAIIVGGFFACAEEGRFEIASNDTTPPQAPEYLSYKPLNGGARLFYDIPNDEDILSIDAEFVTKSGKPARFSVSYFVDSIDVFGFADTLTYKVQLYARDRAGNKSKIVDVSVKPLESILSIVAREVVIKPSFGAFRVDWTNKLEQNINLYVDFSFTENGKERSFTQVFSSKKLIDRQEIKDLNLSPQESVKVKVRVEDLYGNMTDPVDMGEVFLYNDIELPKTAWVLPAPNDSIAGIPMCYGNAYEGHIEYVYDGFIQTTSSSQNYCNMGDKGRTGFVKDGLLPWNLMIDLGDYYELSRIRTHQRRFGDGGDTYSKGVLYDYYNVGKYNMYLWNDDTNDWELINQVRIPIPENMSELDIIKQAIAGDVAFMYPETPGFTKPTRWFRFEALNGFRGNYTGLDAACLSELTLYGRKVNK
jgi:hypothetical protein